MKNIVLITKDALPCGYLPVYGNTYWSTPHMDELAAKGTVFHRHYTVAPSTFMAFTSMATGIYPYQTDRKYYRNESSLNGSTIFDRLYEQGYSCHIAWDTFYTDLVAEHFKAEGNHTTVHDIKTIREKPHSHIKGVFDDLSKQEEETVQALSLIDGLFRTVSEEERPVVLWLHIPHVIKGQNGYGSDVEAFDHIIGLARKHFADDEIAFSADHGHMDGWWGKYNYGFDVHDSAIRIPLVTPRLEGLERVDDLTVNAHILKMLAEEKIYREDYVISDTAYYVQPKREIAIIREEYKLIYSKQNKRYSLYDLSWDPQEKHNLYYAEYYDVDREIWSSTNQRFFYPHWEKAHGAARDLETILSQVWRHGTFTEESFEKFVARAKAYYRKLVKYRLRKRVPKVK